jgi:Ca-activated chloride channel family protein
MNMRRDERRLTIEELAKSVGVPVRTVRFYITEGLIPGPGSRGKGATYGEEHLAKLALVRRLAERRVPLSDIREQVSRLSLAEVRDLLEEQNLREAQLNQAEQSSSPKEYVSELMRPDRARSRPGTTEDLLIRPMSERRQASFLRNGTSFRESSPPRPERERWYRWQLVPGVELHVSQDASKRFRDLIRRLRRMADESPRK